MRIRRTWMLAGLAAAAIGCSSNTTAPGSGGTGNGALFSPATVGAADGFATSRGQELLLRATLATHGDAVSYCRHGVGG